MKMISKIFTTKLNPEKFLLRGHPHESQTSQIAKNMSSKNTNQHH